MPDVKWIKITTDIFDDEKILMIESLPSADSIIVIWFKLLTFAGKQNNDGVFIMNNRIAYTDEMLASIFRRDINTVRLSLKTFEDFGMIDIIDNVITIPNWSKHQTLDAYEKKKARDRERMVRKREEQRILAEKSSNKSPDKSPDKSLDKSPDKSLDKSNDVAITERDKERDTDLEKEKERIHYNVVVDDYNRICANLPKVTALSEDRKKAIKARINKYGSDGVMKAFRKASESDFLNGTNGRNWRANFDWLMKDANMAKILDGNYDNRGQAECGDYFSRNGIDDPLKDLDIDFSEG